MSQVPTFNLGKTKINLDEVNADLTAATSKSKGYAPGNYTVVVKNPRYHVHKKTGLITCSDASWVAVAMELVSADGRSKFHYITVPTDTPYWNSTGKKNLFKFVELQRFLAGIGVELTVGNMGEVIPALFGDEAALANLAGSELNIDIGFKGPYVKFVSSEDCRIVIDGEEYSEGTGPLVFPDPDSAMVYGANTLGLQLQRWPEVLKIYPAEKATEPKKANESW